MSGRERRGACIARAVGVGFICLLLAGLCGCAPTPIQPLPSLPSFRLAVLDFRVPDSWRDPEAPDRVDRELKGWWFSSRDIWHNPGIGRVAGDIFHHKINLLSFVNTVSRVDIKYYMADKRELIRQALDKKRAELEAGGTPPELAEAQRIRDMSEADYDRLLERLPPREIGLELKCDRVLVGRIHEGYLAHHRAFDIHWSYVDLEVSLIDVDTGRVVWHKRGQYKKNFASTSFLLEAVAEQMIEAMKFEYLYQPR